MRINEKQVQQAFWDYEDDLDFESFKRQLEGAGHDKISAETSASFFRQILESEAEDKLLKAA